MFWHKRNSLIAIVLFCLLNLILPSVLAQTTANRYVISPFKTHFGIDRFRPRGKAKHTAFINPNVTAKNLLVVHFPGSNGVPENSDYWLGNAANQGFHAVGLAYLNELAIGVICNDSSDPNCYETARLEVIDGVEGNPNLFVRKTDSIEFRIVKLLEYLRNYYPSENWGQFLDAENKPVWSKLVLSGHSQGAGHAALMAKTRNVARVVQFTGSADYSMFFNATATWHAKPSLTPTSKYFGFGHQRDQIVPQNRLLQNWAALGMNAFGSPVLVDTVASPYQNSHQVYTNVEAQSAQDYHGSMIVDGNVPLDANNQPVFLPVWNYLLNVSSTPLSFSSTVSYRPPQTDANGNAMTGTELVHLTPHKGKLYASTSLWMESHPSISRAAQILVLDLPTANWKVDRQFSIANLRVTSMESITFTSDGNGNPITPEPILMASPNDALGTATVFVRDDATNNWVSTILSQGSDQMRVRSIRFHRDTVTGIEKVLSVQVRREFLAAFMMRLWQGKFVGI